MIRYRHKNKSVCRIRRETGLTCRCCIYMESCSSDYKVMGPSKQSIGLSREEFAIFKDTSIPIETVQVLLQTGMRTQSLRDIRERILKGDYKDVRKTRT